MKKRYQFRDGYRRAKGLVADNVAQELERIRQRRGLLTAEIVLEESRKKSSPLHAAFIWDDKEAAHQFRLMQARQLIRSIEIVYEEREDQPRPQFFITKKEDVKQYQPLEVVVHDQDMYEYTVQKVQSMLESAQRMMTTLEHMHGINTEKRKKAKAISQAISSAAQAAGRV